MRLLDTLLCSIALYTCASIARGEPATQPGSVSALFDYDASRSLQIDDRVVTTAGGIAIHDISYASSGDMRVSAYLVVPAARGPFAGVLFGHWANGTRAEFLAEALSLAKAGAISLLPDYPWDRAPPYRRSLGHFDKPELDHQATVQVIVDLRRGLDLLVSRSDVDRGRIAYVGHSFGAQWGAILPTVDPRIHTTVLIAGVPETADLYLRSNNPVLVELRGKIPAGQLQNYVQVMSDLDAIRFVPNIGHIPVLMQFGRYEQYFDRGTAEHYALAAREPKRVLWYDADHEVNDPKAALDRSEWLRQHIRLTGGMSAAGARQSNQ